MDGQVLGVGSFGTVTKGTLRGNQVAVKVIKAERLSKSETALQNFREECALMSKLRHPNVLLMMGVTTIATDDGEDFVMVTEYMPRGSIFSLLHVDQKKKVPFKVRMNFAKGTALGMNWLHKQNPPVVHLDLKSQNILVDQAWVAKVADFGLSRVKGSTTGGMVGSPGYMAPEILSEKPYTTKSDVYSFGIVLWELLSQEIPYNDIDFRSIDEIYSLVVVNEQRPKIPDKTPAQLERLIRSCWATNPDERPSFQTILESHDLDNVILDAIIDNPANKDAKTFWKLNFSTSEEIHEVVSWNKFIKALVKYCNLDLEPGVPLENQLLIKAVKLVLVGNQGVVTLEKFAKNLEWFGPLTTDSTFVEHILDIISIKGFYGDISTKDAERLMAGKKPGRYIVRFSGQQPGYYTVTSMSSEKTLRHYRIKHRAGLGYVLGNQEHKTLPALIKHHRRDMFLKAALKGSKYEQMKIEHEENMESAYQEFICT